MRALLFIVMAVASLQQQSARAQRLVHERFLHRHTPDTVYQWVDNRLILKEYRGDCRRLTAKAARGNISWDTSASDPCAFIYTCPASVAGFDTIVIEAGRGGRARTTATAIFPVKPFPTPIVELAGKAGGTIYRVILQAQVGLIAPSSDGGCKTIHADRIVRITEYRVQVLRGQDVVFEDHIANNGDFSGAAKAFFQNRIRAGDQLRSFDIRLLIYKQERRRTTQELWFDIR